MTERPWFPDTNTARIIMKQSKLEALRLMIGAAAMVAALTSGRAADEPLDAETKERIERFEKGAATVERFQISRRHQGELRGVLRKVLASATS